MTELVPDKKLLGEYIERQSEEAFGALVERHIHLVYGTARRRLADPGAAQEISQNVFATLARKAPWLSGENNLAGWLHRATCLETTQWWRGELRRRHREETAAQKATAMHEENAALTSMTPVLDEGLMELRESDRQALLLRFFEGRTHREIGAMLGTGEDAARKRVDKALEQLTRFFQRRGFAVSSSLMTAAVLQSGFYVAPAALAGAAAQGAMAAAGAGAFTGFTILFAKFMALTKTQTAAVAIAMAALPIGYQVHELEEARAERTVLLNELAGTDDSLARLDRQRREMESQISRFNRSLDWVRADTERQEAFAAAARTNFYQWVDRSDYIRVPKDLIPELTLADADLIVDAQGQAVRIRRAAFSGDGTLSNVLQEALAITPAQAGQVKAAFAEFSRAFRAEANALRYETNAPPFAYSTALPESRTFVTPPFPARGEQLAEWLFGLWSDYLGAERAAILREQSKGLFEYEFNSFGKREMFETVFWGENEARYAYGIGYPGQGFNFVGSREQIPDHLLPYLPHAGYAETQPKSIHE
jgi:RNA polymerase sigma factor (sigma-70 family)